MIKEAITEHGPIIAKGMLKPHNQVLVLNHQKQGSQTLSHPQDWCHKDLNVSHKAIKILEENIGSEISDISCSNIFANISPQARETKEKKQMGLHQAKKLWHSKRNHQQNEKGIH